MATALTTHSRRSLGLLMARAPSKGTVERFSFRFRERPALLVVLFEFRRVKFTVEVLLTLVGKDVNTVSEKTNKPVSF